MSGNLVLFFCIRRIIRTIKIKKNTEISVWNKKKKLKIKKKRRKERKQNQKMRGGGMRWLYKHIQTSDG